MGLVTGTWLGTFKLLSPCTCDKIGLMKCWLRFRNRQPAWKPFRPKLNSQTNLKSEFKILYYSGLFQGACNIAVAGEQKLHPTIHCIYVFYSKKPQNHFSLFGRMPFILDLLVKVPYCASWWMHLTYGVADCAVLSSWWRYRRKPNCDSTVLIQSVAVSSATFFDWWRALFIILVTESYWTVSDSTILISVTVWHLQLVTSA